MHIGLVGLGRVDVPGSERLTPGQAVDFTFWWPEAGRWEGRDLHVDVAAETDRGRMAAQEGVG